MEHGELKVGPVGAALPDLTDLTDALAWESIGTVDDVKLTGDELADWAGEADTLADVRRTVAMRVQVDGLDAQRRLSRVLGGTIPTTAGIMLHPDTERRAGAREYHDRQTRTLVQRIRANRSHDGAVPVIRFGGRRNGKAGR